MIIGAEPTGHYWFTLAEYLHNSDAKLVLEGRYCIPHIPEGVYAELCIAMNMHWRVNRELAAVKNQIQRWLEIYFPEHNDNRAGSQL